MSDHTPTLPKTKEIPLTQGYVATVDAADYEWLKQWNWRVLKQRDGKALYAIRNKRLDDGSFTTVRMHREIAGADQGVLVDHCDHNGLNNRRDNLRIATNQQNGANRPATSRNKHGFKGVDFIASTGKWRARIMVDGKNKHLGLFGCAEDAARAYDKAAKEIFGSFAYVNPEGAL